MRFNAHRLLAPTCRCTDGRGTHHPLRAQNTITLEGSVKAEGSPIASAQVTVVNTATQETARSTTRANGEFRVLGLFTGKYVGDGSCARLQAELGDRGIGHRSARAPRVRDAEGRSGAGGDAGRE